MTSGGSLLSLKSSKSVPTILSINKSTTPCVFSTKSVLLTLMSFILQFKAVEHNAYISISFATTLLAPTWAAAILLTPQPQAKSNIFLPSKIDLFLNKNSVKLYPPGHNIDHHGKLSQ